MENGTDLGGLPFYYGIQALDGSARPYPWHYHLGRRYKIYRTLMGGSWGLIEFAPDYVEWRRLKGCWKSTMLKQFESYI